MEDVRSQFTANEWAELVNGPLYVLGVVAAADWNVDRSEWAALMGAVAGAAGDSHPLVREVMTAALEAIDAAGNGHPAVAAALDGLRTIDAILDRKHPADESGLRESLLEIGAAVAEASGARLVPRFLVNHGTDGWSPASRISAMERDALKAAAGALGIEPA